MEPNSVESTARKSLVVGIAGLTIWKFYLIFRQIVLVAGTHTVPYALSKGMSQADFVSYRQVAFVSLIGNGFEVIRAAVTTISRIYKGYPAWVWDMTSKFADSPDSRTLLYPILEIVLANWFTMVFIFIIFMAKWNLLTVLTFYLYVVYIIIASTVVTYMMISLTKLMGPSSLLYAAIPLNVLEMLKIIAVIEFVLPNYCKQLPPDAQLTLNPVANLVNYPTSRICMLPEETMDSSPNAGYVGLLGFKIIIIYESLLKSVGLTNTRSVLAHELGHWARGHMAVGVTTRLFQTILSCFMLAVSYGSSLIFQVFGFQESDPPHPVIGVLVCWQYVVPVLNAVILGISTIMSYFCEYEADHFAVDMGLGEGLISALTTLVSGIKRFPLHDSWFAAWFIGHPDILDRVDRIIRAIN